MEDTEFDRALIAAAFDQAALTGWRNLSVADATRAAGLPLDRARARFPVPALVLVRFGRLADQAALAEVPTEPLARDRLFDLLMRRFDVLQHHREGMLALLQALPANPPLALALSAATARSMGWMLEAAGVSAQGLAGCLRVTGLVGVWLYALRAWKDDASADLAGTMAALDKALDRAEKMSGILPAGKVPEEPPMEGVVDVPAEEADPAAGDPPPEPPAPAV
jgi:ubiquinone biosynthesis protein COQ9